MEILLIVLGCSIFVLLGYAFKEWLKKVKKGNSILAKKLTTRVRVLIAVILVFLGLGYCLYAGQMGLKVNTSWLASLVALLLISLFIQEEKSK
jgi:uncharacterized membrane protein YobD (UPF0266 family)